MKDIRIRLLPEYMTAMRAFDRLLFVGWRGVRNGMIR